MNATGRSRPFSGDTSSCAAQNAWPRRAPYSKPRTVASPPSRNWDCCNVGLVAIPAFTRSVAPRSPPTLRRRSPNSRPVVRPSPPSTSAVTLQRTPAVCATRADPPANVPSSTGGIRRE